MRMQIGRWGNSLAIRLPRELVERYRLREGAELDLSGLERSLEVERAEAKEQRRREALRRIGETRLHLPSDWKLTREEMNARPGSDH